VPEQIFILHYNIFFSTRLCYGTEQVGSVSVIKKKKNCFSAAPSSRIDLGLPADWLIIEDWLSEVDLATAGQTVKQCSAPSKDSTDARVFTWDAYPSKDIPFKSGNSDKH
jgi:hypothetical protein